MLRSNANQCENKPLCSAEFESEPANLIFQKIDKVLMDINLAVDFKKKKGGKSSKAAGEEPELKKVSTEPNFTLNPFL